LTDFSHSELDVLYKLRKRRQDITTSSNWLDVKKEAVFSVGRDIERKIEKLEQTQSKLTALIAEYKKIGDIKLLKLARMYENMKPKDAANIFDVMDLGVVADIASNMKEAKLAAIVAEMEPSKANGLSVVMRSSPVKDIVGSSVR
jgi:flagellar motility protein MotE (MotC chaperone)